MYWYAGVLNVNESGQGEGIPPHGWSMVTDFFNVLDILDNARDVCGWDLENSSSILAWMEL